MSDLHAVIDTTRSDQPIFQTVSDILSHSAEAGLDAVIPLDQNHPVTSSHIQKDKPLGDLIVHV
jgi:hypothetical protein